MSHEHFPTETPAVVTCGLPYANGKLHLGHLRTYVGGDVLARALRTLGQQTAFVSGSDMHGTPIAVNARQDGVSPESFALQWHEMYRTMFPRFHIEFDNYGHTRRGEHRTYTRDSICECVQLVKAIAILLEPVMPEKSAQLWEQLGETSSVHTTTLDTVFEPPSAEFREVSELFDPITDDQITVLEEQLQVQRTED